MLSAELGRFEGYFSSERRLELLALAGGLLFGLALSVARRRPEPLAIGLLLAFALFVLVVSGKSEFYIMLFYPWLCLLLAGAVVWLAQRTGRAWPLVVLAAFWVGPRIFGFEEHHDDLLIAAGNFPERGYYALMADITPLVPPGASVLGPPLFWIGLHDRSYTDYYVWERLRAERGERFASFAARLKPDVLVLDAKSQHQISINSPGYLESNGVLLKTIRRVGFDRVEVWKLS
jgi:hypothetical protein